MKKRKLFIDALRGFALLNMIFYHGLYDVVYIFHQNISWYSGKPGYLWQQSIAMTFILVSGFTRHLSTKPVKDGIVVFVWGFVLSLVTTIFMPDQKILFGILSFMGLAILITWLFEKRLQRIPPIAGLLLSLFLFIITKDIQRGSLLFGQISLPGKIYEIPGLFILGFPDSSFFSTDYFPILPWIFLFIAGYYIGLLYKKKKITVPNIPKKENLLTFLGKHSLKVYLFHQPILYVFLSGIFYLWNK